jgi:DNA-binding response OmpR family regulator
VDDDITTRRLECMFLAHAGYTVDAAADGEEVWTALLTGAFDLLVTDHDMPRLCGLDLVTRMRAAGMRLPVIISSGCLNLAEAPEYPYLDLAAVLHKPFGLTELMETVKQMLPLPQVAVPGAAPGVSPAATRAAPRPLDLRLASPTVPAGLPI